MVTLHGPSLFRHFTQSGDLASVASIYHSAILPVLEPSWYHLCGLRHRAIIADKLASFLVTHRMCEKARVQPMVLLQDPRKIVTLRLAVIGLRPYFFILYHFFEAFRAILAYTSECKGAWGDARIENTIGLIESWLLERYTAAARSRALRLWEQIMKLVYRKFRPATYATKVERTLRRWNHPPACEHAIRDLLAFGGLEALYGVIIERGYASRMKAFDKAVLQVQTSSETVMKNDMRVVFGIMPPLPATAITFIHKRMLPNEHMRILGGVENTPTAPTQEEQDTARNSILGLIAPLCVDCDMHDNPKLVADNEGQKPDSLEICLRNPDRYLKKNSRVSSLGIGLDH